MVYGTIYRMIYIFIFSWLVYWYVHYQFDKEYEFGKLKSTLGLNKAIDKNVHPAIVGFGAFVLMVTLVIVLNKVILWLNYNHEFLFAPILYLGTWGCIRDMKPIKRWGNSKLTVMLILVLSWTVGLAWIYLPTWYSYNIAAFVVAINLMRALSPIKFKYLLYIVGFIVLYDYWGVYMSQEIVQAVKTSTEISGRIPPLVVLVPNTGSYIGIGDIVFPGLVFATAMRIGVAMYTVVGYGVGLAITFFILSVVGGHLPALLFLAPATLAGAQAGRIIEKKTGIPW